MSGETTVCGAAWETILAQPDPGETEARQSVEIDAASLMQLDGIAFVGEADQRILDRTPVAGEIEHHLAALGSGALTKDRLIRELLSGDASATWARPLRIRWVGARPAGTKI